MDVKERIARRAAAEINDGDVVNLGIGLPTLAAGYVNEDYDIVLQSENGILGMGGIAPQGKEDKKVTKEEINYKLKGLEAVPIGIDKNTLNVMSWDFKNNFTMICHYA